jgi:hypothetical protein
MSSIIILLEPRDYHLILFALASRLLITPDLDFRTSHHGHHGIKIVAQPQPN